MVDELNAEEVELVADPGAEEEGEEGDGGCSDEATGSKGNEIITPIVVSDLVLCGEWLTSSHGRRMERSLRSMRVR